MFLQIELKKADLYIQSKKILHLCYEITQDITAPEKLFLFEQIRKAAILIHLNIIKGLFSDKEKVNKSRLKKAKDALVIVDAGLEIILQLGWVTTIQIEELEEQIKTTFGALNNTFKT